MSLTEDLYRRALAVSSPGQREVELAELGQVLRYDEDAEIPAVVAQTRLTLECGTCCYWTDFGTIERRDELHCQHDGAHEPSWYHDDMLIRSDLDLIRAIVGETCSQCRPGHRGPDGRCERHGKLINPYS